MRVPLRLLPVLIALTVALAFIAISNSFRIERVHALTNAGDEVIASDAHSPTGFAGGVRQLIVANHDNDSYQWLAQAEQGITQDEWRVRHVDYDNAPFGRVVYTPSLYRWWLALAAHGDHLVSGRPLAASVEHSAPYADPVLEVLLLIVSAIFVLRWFGVSVAAITSVALVFSFPLASWFIGGEPNDHGLALVAAWWSVLPLLIALRGGSAPNFTSPRQAHTARWFFGAGVLGGVALWLNTMTGLAFIFGVLVGGILLAILTRRSTNAAVSTGASGSAPPWMLWSLGGAVTTLAAYFIEYFPNYMAGWRLDFIHPLYGIGWLGAGGALTWLSSTIARRRPVWGRRSIVLLTLAVLAIGATVFAAYRSGSTASMTAALALEPSRLPEALGPDNLWSWIKRAGVVTALWPLVPLLLISGLALWSLRRRGDTPETRAITLAFGPVVVLFALACERLYWWNGCDAAVLALLVAWAATASIDPARSRWIWSTVTLGAFLPCAWLLGTQAGMRLTPGFTENDVIALVERDLSHWLANRAGSPGAVVLAPPNLTTSLYFHGGLRGLGTPYWDNKEGMNAAVRLAGASSPDEGLALARRRGVDYIALPSWDNALDELVQASSNEPGKSLLGLLHQWHAPRWLRPVPYPMPEIPGFEGRSVAVFQVVDVQDNAIALSRLAEYFVEMGRLNDAAAVAITLERAFPNDVGAMIARAAVANAYGDSDRTAAALQVLTSSQSVQAVAALPWDRKVSDAIALAQGQRIDLAREEVVQCLADVDEAKLRFLTPQSLYRFLLLCKMARLELPTPKLKAVAHQLLPPELRDKV